ncbi:3-deoxy-7-phosphoheptulonate synthase [Aeromonas caviae]|uniref:3-deoxy-7-phosphoheptulonate synthase n=1 Tax=Aeromonas caviae TaxID=648 RepID=UPI003305C1CD
MAVLNSVMRAFAIEALPTPAELLAQPPCPADMARHIDNQRHQARRILAGEDDRLLVVIGPCSIHDPVAALDYAGRLARLATEFLDTTSFLYLADLVSWGAIGARTTESQVHRQLASALPCPVGFKNGTDGNIRVAIDAIQASTASHLFTAPGSQGGMVVIKSEGNPDGHIILRGGTLPNYHQSDVAEAADRLTRQGLPPRLMVDCSHGNSQKLHTNQLKVAKELCRQLSEGSQAVAAVMVESFLLGGNQKPAPLGELQYGLSVTDACLCWEESEHLLAMLAEAVQARRRTRRKYTHAVQSELGQPVI